MTCAYKSVIRGVRGPGRSTLPIYLTTLCRAHFFILNIKNYGGEFVPAFLTNFRGGHLLFATMGLNVFDSISIKIEIVVLRICFNRFRIRVFNNEDISIYLSYGFKFHITSISLHN